MHAQARRFFPCLLLCLALTGCLEVEDTWTLNPDGSGKVARKVVFGKSYAAFSKPSKIARELIEKCAGVEVWSDVSSKKLKDGRIEVRGTAFFKDASKVALEHDLLEAVFARTKAGLVLTVKPDFGKKDKKGKAKGPIPADMKGLGEMLRGGWAIQRAPLEAMIGGLKARARYHLPGTLSEQRVLTGKQGEGLTVSVTGKQILDRVDAVIDAMAKASDSKELTPKDLERLKANLQVKLLAGKPHVKASGGKPLFDYAAASAAAKKAWPAIRQRLGIPILGKQGAPLSKLKVVGVRYVQHHDADVMDLTFVSLSRPDEHETHAHVHLTAQLPAGALEITGGAVGQALDLAGKSLLFEDEDRHELKSTGLDTKTKTLSFQLVCKLPSPGALGFRKLSGKVKYLLPGGKKDQLLPFKALAKGQTCARYKATLKELEHKAKDALWKARTEFQLKLEGLRKSQLAGVYALLPNGKRLPCTYHSSSFGSLSVWAKSPQPLPTGTKIGLSVYTRQTQHTATFSLGPLDARGLPMAKKGGKQ